MRRISSRCTSRLAAGSSTGPEHLIRRQRWVAWRRHRRCLTPWRLTSSRASAASLLSSRASAASRGICTCLPDARFAQRAQRAAESRRTASLRVAALGISRGARGERRSNAENYSPRRAPCPGASLLSIQEFKVLDGPAERDSLARPRSLAPWTPLNALPRLSAVPCALCVKRTGGGGPQMPNGPGTPKRPEAAAHPLIPSSPQ